MQNAIKKIEKIIGKENISTFKEDLICYSFDANTKSKLPDAVVFPKNISEISKIVKIANKNKIYLTVRGNGTGMTGGSIPVLGGIVIAMSRFNKILEIDEENFIATVESGVITGDFKKIVEKKIYFIHQIPRVLIIPLWVAMLQNVQGT